MLIAYYYSLILQFHAPASLIVLCFIHAYANDMVKTVIFDSF